MLKSNILYVIKTYAILISFMILINMSSMNL